jgi:type VI protein secretion system component VasA
VLFKVLGSTWLHYEHGGALESATSDRVKGIRREQHNRNVSRARIAFEFSSRADAVEARHHDVHYDDVRAQSASRLDGADTFVRDLDIEPSTPKVKCKRVSRVDSVVDNQDLTNASTCLALAITAGLIGIVTFLRFVGQRDTIRTPS